MRKEFIYNLITNLGIGLTFGIIGSFFSTDINSFIIGVLGTSLVYLIQIQSSVSNSESLQKIILESLKKIKSGNIMSDLILKYGLKNIHLNYERGLKVEGDDFWDLWVDCLFKTKSSWKGLSFNDSWQSSMSSYGKDFEILKIQRDCSIKRVFIYENDESFNKINTTIKSQIENGIEAKSINKKTLLKSLDIKESKQIIKTLDFAIIDETWVLLVYLKRNKKINYAILTDNSELLKHSKIIFNESFEKGNNNS